MLRQCQRSCRKTELLCNNNMVGLTLQQKEIRLDFYRVSFVILANNMINIEWIVKASFMLRLAQIKVTDYPASLYWQKFPCLQGSFIQKVSLLRELTPGRKKNNSWSLWNFCTSLPFPLDNQLHLHVEVKVYSLKDPAGLPCRHAVWQ